MINPLACATRILRENPDFAEPLFDLFICAREGQGARIEAELDDVEDFLYSKTPHGVDQRERHKKKRLQPATKEEQARLLA